MTGNPLLDSDEYARLISPQEPPREARPPARQAPENCPACECPFYEKLYRIRDQFTDNAPDDQRWLVQCDNCRLVRLFPWPDPVVPPLVEPVPFAGTPQSWSWFYTSHLDFIDETIAHVRGPGILLSSGRSHEPLLKLLQERRLPVVSMDVSLATASAVWHEGTVPACVGDFLHPPFLPGSCGLILLLHTLEYLPDPATYLEHVWRLLQPAGRLVVQCPNIASWQFLWRGSTWSSLDAPRRLFHFRSSELRILLESCGFEVVRERQFTWRDSPTALASSLAPRLDPRRRRLKSIPEAGFRRFWSNCLYTALTLAALPFALLEAFAWSGATVLMEARKVIPTPKENHAS